MLAALVADGARAPDLDVSVLVAEGLSPLLPAYGAAGVPAGVRVVVVPPGAEPEALRSAARDADWTVVVAPETDGILAARVALVRTAGGRVAAPDDRFIAVAGDKQATVRALAAAGVPVPAGRLLEPGEEWPVGFALPAVVKARAGCGGDGLAVLRGPAELLPAEFSRRLEAHAAGTPDGVSCLCGAEGPFPLPPVRQRFSTGRSPRFLGGDLGLPAAAAARATQLARRAITALEWATGPAVGWVGVDMILGSRDDGAHDRVLEINPRLTTSFVGLSAQSSRSLLRALLARGAGEPVDWPGEPHGDGSFAIGTTEDPSADAHHA
jgi:predicted ATP-grasp superfamily ATP-dependent carboligase